MTRSIFAALALGLTLALTPASAAAQEAPLRSGFWSQAGLGWGSLGCQDCASRETGFSGGLALGGAVSPRVLLGVDTNGWTKSENGVTLTTGTLTAQIRFYPSATGNFFLLGDWDTAMWISPWRGSAS